ncbi:hypothetical protein [Roseitranquillus sediminis]|uniref:hypothetical protein n=1 Tax=Roseitranquillus sediminis TaxID=2809051 RepID=UPI001D0C8536|nr:hypothetical protein [Roseitranquillus sediminis]MBM9594994.1 hypothetical protein [Roseitranquillus sediminis]
MRFALAALTAVALPLAAKSQPLDTCLPGPVGTVSDCTDTVVTNPPAVQDFSQGEFINPDADATLGPAGLGDIEVGGVIGDGYDEIGDPDTYGLDPDENSIYYDIGGNAVRVDRASRRVIEIRPFGDIGIGGADAGIGDYDADIGPEEVEDLSPGISPPSGSPALTDSGIGN